MENPKHIVPIGDAEQLYGIPNLPFRPAMKVIGSHQLVFLAGVLGPATREDPDTSIEGEVRRAYENLAQILRDAGGQLTDVVSMTKFLTNIERDNDVVASLTRKFFPHLVTTTTVEVSRLVPQSLHFEVSAIAAIRD